jgi:hypothetical protein
MGHLMNERIKEMMKNAGTDTSGKWMGVEHADKFAELIIKDVANELFVVYPGGKRDSDVEFQNISIRQWIKQVYGVDT